MAGQIDVFISYKLEERALTEGVMRGLRQAGFTAVTNFNIVKSQEFGDAIDTMIRTARLTLVLWTKASSQSDWVRKEARLAHELEKAGKPNRYIGVMVEDVGLDLPVDLRGLQMIDLSRSGMTRDGIAEVVRVVREIMGPARAVSAEAAETSSTALMDEFQLYEYARTLDLASGYEHFLSIYPNGRFAADARRELRVAKAWYMHPFRRTNIGHSLVAISIAITLLTVWLGSSPPNAVSGVPQIEHDRTVAELSDARFRLASAEARLTSDAALVARLQAEAFSYATEKNQLNSQIESLTKTLDTRQTELDAARSSVAGSDAAIVTLQAKHEKAQTEYRATNERLAWFTRTLGVARSDLAKANSEIASHLDEIKSLTDQLSYVRKRSTEKDELIASSLSQSESTQPYVANDCFARSSPGIRISGNCYPTTSLQLFLPNAPIFSLSGFSNFKNLRELYLYGTQVRDLTPIAGMNTLEVLDVSGTLVFDLKPIQQLSNIKRLDVSATRVDRLDAIVKLIRLQTLNLRSTPIKDLSPLKGLPELVILTIPDGTMHRGRNNVLAAINAFKP